MKKVVMFSAVAALALLVDAQTASARGRGGCGGCGYSGGYSCGYGGCYSGGYGGCSSCGSSSGHGGCATCGYGGTYSTGGSCAGGVCAVTGTGGAAMAAAPSMAATLVVNLPADAKLTIDGEATTSTSANRTFLTPDLPDAKEHHYTLQAEVVRDGEVQKTTRQVTVRAGQTTQVELTLPAPTVAAQ